MPLSQSDAEALARRYTEAWCAHDPDGVAAFFAPDGALVINGGEPARGRAGIAEAARGFFEAFPDLFLRLDGVRCSGTHCVYLWTLEGTNSGPGGQGNRVEASGWEYWTFDAAGRISRSLGHFDEADYERQRAGG